MAMMICYLINRGGYTTSCFRLSTTNLPESSITADRPFYVYQLVLQLSTIHSLHPTTILFDIDAFVSFVGDLPSAPFVRLQRWLNQLRGQRRLQETRP